MASQERSAMTLELLLTFALPDRLGVSGLAAINDSK
jgi:hypothetical protein